MKHAIIEIARRSLPLMNPTHRAEAERLINFFERTPNAAGDDDELTAFHDRAAAAWERDMAPARDAIVKALQDGAVDKGYGLCPMCGAPGVIRERRPDGDDTCANGHVYPARSSVNPFKRLRAQLPDLLDQVNARPSLAAVLSRQLFRVSAASLDDDAEWTANAVTASVEQWRSREIFPTDFSSSDLRGLSTQFHLRSIFSARTTNADYLDEVGRVVDEMLDGKIDLATARWQLMKKLKQLGYDPEKGFPQDMALIPPAERGSLQDLSSKRRLDLMLRTNLEMTRNYTRVLEGNTETARRMFPAWELRRVSSRRTPRGTPDSHTVGWLQRWKDAADSVGWEGVSRAVFAERRMIARKDSPIWQALGDGAGGYTDTLGHNFGPFAFNSGMDQVAVPRAEWERLAAADRSSEIDDRSSISETPAPLPVQLAPTQSEAKKMFDALSPDLRAKLLERWAA